jgi:hypothetical protein
VAYEVSRRTGVRVDGPTLSIIPDGRIGVNAAAARILVEAGVKSVFLLWDKANHRIAAKSAPKNDKNAYSVSITTSHNGSIRAKQFLSHIGWNASTRETLPATWNEKEKMFEVTLPERYLATPPTRTQKGQT